MGMIQEFKEFAVKGNAFDLAVGVIIGGAFGGIVKSLTDDLIMPLIGTLVNVKFDQYYIKLKDAKTPGQYDTYQQLTEAGGVGLGIGTFVGVIINFVIVAFAIFMLVKAMNKMMRSKEEAPAAPPAPAEDVVLLGEIRDLLKSRG